MDPTAALATLGIQREPAQRKTAGCPDLPGASVANKNEAKDGDGKGGGRQAETAQLQIYGMSEPPGKEIGTPMQDLLYHFCQTRGM